MHTFSCWSTIETLYKIEQILFCWYIKIWSAYIEQDLFSLSHTFLKWIKMCDKIKPPFVLFISFCLLLINLFCT